MRKTGLSRFQGQQTDGSTECLSERRRFENVGLSILMQAWTDVGQLLVLLPADPEITAIYSDLQNEFELRGLKPPIEVARSQVLHFGKAMADLFEEMQLDSPAKSFGRDQRTIDALKFLRAISAPAS